tara:strand:- start:335 stop:859 length:525 start_codon:yes stop_codon:yes gene_type:complete
MTPDIDPIEFICSVLGELPMSLQQPAITRASTAIGLEAPLTGLEAVPERSWHELHWDLKVSDLREHLTRFIECANCDPRELVQSILNQLESYFRVTSVQERADNIREEMGESIRRLQEDQARPLIARISMLDDDGILVLIKKLESISSDAETQCRDAKEAIAIIESAQSRIAAC